MAPFDAKTPARRCGHSAPIDGSHALPGLPGVCRPRPPCSGHGRTDRPHDARAVPGPTRSPLVGQCGVGVGHGGPDSAHPRTSCLRDQSCGGWRPRGGGDRKSTRLNSSHVKISYAVFCLKKKNKNNKSFASKKKKKKIKYRK